MSKTILFPTDFNLLSLKPVQTAIADHPEEKLDIVLVHGIHLSDSITDLLFFSKGTIIQELSNAEFEHACTLLRNMFSKNINSLRIELFTGFTQSAFNAFLAGLQVKQIYLPATALRLSNKMSMDLSRFITKCDIEKVIHAEDQALEPNQANRLFSQVNFAK